MMNTQHDQKTARLAAFLGAALLEAGQAAGPSRALDARLVRELSVIARVLEKRLEETRRSIGRALPPPLEAKPESGVAA